jgi:hypothetical protein
MRYPKWGGEVGGKTLNTSTPLPPPPPSPPTIELHGGQRSFKGCGEELLQAATKGALWKGGGDWLESRRCDPLYTSDTRIYHKGTQRIPWRTSVYAHWFCSLFKQVAVTRLLGESLRETHWVKGWASSSTSVAV